MSRFAAILFDLDGILIDSEPIGMRSIDLLLARYGHSAAPGYGHQFIGRRAHDTATQLVAEFGLAIAAEALMTEHRDLIWDLVEREVVALPGVEQIMHSARQLGLRCAVATSAPRPYLRMVLEKFNWGAYFAASVTGEEVAQGKPAPDIFLRAAELLGVAAQDCLVLEDAPHGVAAGLAAGMTVIAIPNTITSQLTFPPVSRMPSLQAVARWLEGGACDV